jgi:ABC transport system ATP-binding/permease protein
VETMKVWPDDDPKARPASDFFVNDRIDLLVREAETFRNDYRNTESRHVFHALKKPLPFIAEPPAPGPTFSEPHGHLDTQRFCGFILLGIILGCGVASAVIIARQNRMTR